MMNLLEHLLQITHRIKLVLSIQYSNKNEIVFKPQQY